MTEIPAYQAIFGGGFGGTMISGRKSCEKEEGLLALSFKMVDIYDDLEDPFFSIQQDIESSEV